MSFCRARTFFCCCFSKDVLLSRLMTGSGRTVAPTEPPHVKKQVKSLTHFMLFQHSSSWGQGTKSPSFIPYEGVYAWEKRWRLLNWSFTLPSLFLQEVRSISRNKEISFSEPRIGKLAINHCGKCEEKKMCVSDHTCCGGEGESEK